MKYFGTDGLRGQVGAWPLVPEALTRLGFSLGQSSAGPVIFGRDTRGSGSWILDALSAGVQAAKKDVWDLGVCPTPVVARVTARQKKGLGVVISASHNPYEDNGIKVLRADGSKASEELEKKIERFLSQKKNIAVSSSGGQRLIQAALVQDDQDDILRRFSHLQLDSLRLAIDTAHGAAWQGAPWLLTELGAQVIQIGATPNGKNINKKCGSLHMRPLQRLVKEKNCHFGFAFDGDADRCLAVNSEGEFLDGDALLAVLSRQLKGKRKASRQVVGTVMTNGGLDAHLKKWNAALIRTPVGDKYVVQEMRKKSLILGGENSGHLVMAAHGYIGDGIVTMLAFLEELQKSDFDLSQALGDYQPWPQVLVNVRVSRKPSFNKNKSISRSVRQVQRELGDSGRLLLRYSGTEPLARVMIEGLEAKKIRTLAESLAKIIQEEIGDE